MAEKKAFSVQITRTYLFRQHGGGNIYGVHLADMLKYLVARGIDPTLGQVYLETDFRDPGYAAWVERVKVGNDEIIPLLARLYGRDWRAEVALNALKGWE